MGRAQRVRALVPVGSLVEVTVFLLWAERASSVREECKWEGPEGEEADRAEPVETIEIQRYQWGLEKGEGPRGR